MSVLNHMSKWFAVNGLIIPDYRWDKCNKI
jgi:hypothetical protein